MPYILPDGMSETLSELCFKVGFTRRKQFIFYFTSSLGTRGDQQSILQCGDPQLEVVF